MSEEMKHTPGPWRWRIPRTGCRQAYLVGSAEIPIAYLAQPKLQDPRKAKANAAFIIRACNSHKALLEACKNFFEWHANHFEEFDDEINGQLLCLANEAEAAITKAEKTD